MEKIEEKIPEIHIGTKFRIDPSGWKREIPRHDSTIPEILKWGKIIAEKELAPRVVESGSPGSMGNISAWSSRDSIIVTATQSDLVRLGISDLAEVQEWNSAGIGEIRKLKSLKEPSSEFFLHVAMYARSGVKAVVHGHSLPMLDASRKGLLPFPVTKKEAPYGSMELVEQASKILSEMTEGNIFFLKNHGFVSFGESVKEACQIAIRAHEECSALIADKN